jgi:hypothetical protein
MRIEWLQLLTAVIDVCECKTGTYRPQPRSFAGDTVKRLIPNIKRLLS